MFDSATHPINVGTCAHNIFCFGGQVINHKYPKHKEIEGLEKSNVQRNAIYIYYNKVLHRKNIIGQISIILFCYILEIVTCLVSSVLFVNRQTTTDIIYSYYHLSEMWLQHLLLFCFISIAYCVCLTTYLQWK